MSTFLVRLSDVELTTLMLGGVGVAFVLATCATASTAGDITSVLFGISGESTPAAADVPQAMDQESPSSEAKEIVEAHLKMAFEFERPIVAPDGRRADRLALPRNAMSAVVGNPAFQHDLIKVGRSTTVLSGQEADALVQAILQSPPAYIELLKKAS